MGTPATLGSTHPVKALVAAAILLSGTTLAPISVFAEDAPEPPHRATATQTSWTGFALLAALFSSLGINRAHGATDPGSTVMRSSGVYQVPDVTLLNASGKEVPLKANLDADKPVMLNFFYTSCTTVCPAMNSNFAVVQARLDPKTEDLRMVSISIDPEQDTPAKLRKYARKFNAGPQWEMLTGSLENSIAVQRAFNAYQGGDKSSCKPITFLRTSKDKPWVRLDGLASADDLLKEYRKLTAMK